MRELTALEIEEFDFSGRIPELNPPGYQSSRASEQTSAKTAGRKFSLNLQSYGQHPARKGRLRTA